MNSNFHLTNETKASTLHRVSLLLFFILALSSFFSPIRALSNLNNIWAIILVLWYAFTLFDKPKFLLGSYFHILIFFFVCYTILASYTFGNSRIGNRYLELSQVFVFYLAYKKNLFIKRPNDNIKLLKWITPFLLFICISTLLAYRFNPNISRGLGPNDELSKQALLQGIGGYEYIYMLVIIFPILLSVLYSFRKNFNLIFQIILALITFLLAYNIIASNYTTAFILTIINFLVVSFIKKINRRWVILFVLLSFLLVVFLPLILTFIKNILGESRNAERIDEIIHFYDNNTLGTAMEARFLAYEKSITTYIQHPIFGVITKNLNYINNGVTGFGQHSAIIDTFALFGTLCGLLFLYLIITPFKRALKNNQVHSNKLAVLTLATFLSILTFNILTPSIGLAAFFIYPTINLWITELNSQ